ncbi:MAG: cytochrome c biogenesis protein ResB [Candidatus Hinthialibacter antarcticus]|nr:cytochrome c biogenesis protein ResB [Candidatus Hinthialibacter antarcticus]
MKPDIIVFLGKELYSFFASLKLAVILLLVFVVLLSYATVYESMHGTPAAQMAIYSTVWFDFLLFLLGVNVLCSAMIRFPWRKRKTGFVITHVGILVILLGALVTRKFGMEGQLMLTEGEIGKSLRMNDSILSISAPQLGVKETYNPNSYMKNGVPSGKSIQYKMGESGLVCYIDQYFDNPRSQEVVKEDGQVANPAIQVSLRRPELTESMSRQWMFALDTQRSQINFGMAKVNFKKANSQEELDKALSAPSQVAPGDSKGKLILSHGTAHVAATIDMSDLMSGPVEFEHHGETYRAEFISLIERGKIQDNQLVEDPEGALNPVARFKIIHGNVEETHMAFALFPEFGSMHGESGGGLSAAYEYPMDQDAGSQNRMDIIVGPEEKLHYRTMNTGGALVKGEIVIGEEINTSWNNLMLKVDQFYPKAKRDFVVVEAGEDAPGQRNNPLLKVRVAHNGREAEGYASYGNPKVLMVAGAPVEVYFGSQIVPLGFSVKLLDFRAPRYPGTNRPMRFESDVMLIDESNAIEEQHLVFMNNPLVYNNFKVYQSSYIEGKNGQPDVSIFTVARAPGTSTIYAGSIIMCLGMILIFGSKNFGYRRTSPFVSGAKQQGE